MKSTWTFNRNAPASTSGPAVASSRRSRAVWLLPVLFALVLVFAGLGLALWLLSIPPVVRVNTDEFASSFRPDVPVEISAEGFGISLANVVLKESTLDIDGRVVSERSVPIQATQLSGTSPVSLESTFRLDPTEGGALLGYDRRYELAFVINSWTPALPLPRQVGEQKQVDFTTIISPQLRVPDKPVALDYQQPIELHWNSPVKNFAVQTTPAVQTRTWVDPAKPDVGYVDLIGAKLGSEYQVKVVEAQGANGAPLIAPATFTAQTATPPEIAVDKVRLEDGTQAVLPWDRPIKGFTYEISPAVDSSSRIDASNPSSASILLKNPKQGQEYTVTVTSAVATTGAPISGTRQFKLAIPPALTVTEIAPSEKYDSGVARDSSINVTFSEPIKNRDAVEASIHVTPAIAGTFKWPQPNKVVFTPKETMAASTDFTLQVDGGPDKGRGEKGGYLEGPGKFAFKTVPDKQIEVNLSQQTLTLWQDGKAVFTTLVSTGVQGANTPPGHYTISYKMEKTRMQGVNPSGSHYDLPDVPWVMPFLGDYCIHGNYWRSTFGVPGSNGCVGMPVDVAKKVYDWTPLGTTVWVHA